MPKRSKIQEPDGHGGTVADGIGPRLAAIREQSQMGQAELARRLGISRFTLNRWERGHRSIDADAIGPMCRVLEVDPSGVLGVNQAIPLPSVNRRLLQLFRAEGTGAAQRRLGVDQSAMDAVLAGKLLVPESDLRLLADAYGVSYTWLLSGKPEHWTPSMETSWCSRLRFFRVSIGGFWSLRIQIGQSSLACADVEILEQLFIEGERSESEAKTLLDNNTTTNTGALIPAYMATNPELSNAIKADFPYLFNGLTLEKPVFITKSDESKK